MSIRIETILNKMTEEVKLANASVDHRATLINHISKVKLLCDLLLDEEEIKAQHSNEIVQDKENIVVDQHPSKIVSDDNEDGTSIFDF